VKSETIPSPRIPIWLQLSLSTMVVLAVSIGILSYVIIERQRTSLYDHIVKLGSVSLSYVADNAKVPLLTNDTLTLSTLINNVASVDGHFYAMIIDTNGVIKAHTDHEKVDTRFEPFTRTGERVQQGAVSYFNYLLPDGRPVLNLSMPILFQEKQLGEVHVGLSIDFIKQLFVDERAFLVVATLIIIGLGMVVAVMYSLRFTRPLSVLVQATSQIARGNYDFKVDGGRNDELGQLGQAFNRMGEELSRQAMIKESFGKYVGSEVLDLITRSPGQSWLKGRRSEASILFADIRGFTAYAEGREPEEVVEKLNDFFAIATEVIFSHGGYVDKFIGDSVLAVFGIPVAHPDHRERCIRAAVAMQRQLARAAGAGNPLLASVGIGISSGIVVAGNIGSSVKMEYTVIGDSVNVASSLNNLAGAGEIIVDSDGATDLGGFAEVEALPPQKIKNREQLVEVFRVVKTLCCLLALLPPLFGCAPLGPQSGDDAAETAMAGPSPALLPDSAQLQAIRDEQSGRYQEALTYWRKAEALVDGKITILTAQLQELAEIYARQGVALFDRKNGDGARQAFLEALRLDPQNETALDYLKNRYQAERTIEYTVREGDSFAAIAESVYGSVDYAFAVRHLSGGGLQDEPGVGDTLLLADLGTLFSQILIDYGKQIRVARRLFADKEYEAVLAVALSILGDNPGDEEASYILNRSLLSLAERFRDEQRYDEAIATLNRVNPAFKNVSPLIEQLGQEQRQKMERDRLQANVELFRRGEQLAARGRYLEALEAFLQVDSTHDGIQRAIAGVKKQLVVQAEEQFKQGVKFFVEEDLVGAIAAWEKALRFDPNHTNAADSLQKALRLLERVREIN